MSINRILIWKIFALYNFCLVPPKVQEIRNQTVDEGKTVTLSCISTGDPPPVMSFQKIGNADTYKNGSNVGFSIYSFCKSFKEINGLNID